MKETPMTIQEVGYLVREAINHGIVDLICLIPGCSNTAD